MDNQAAKALSTGLQVSFSGTSIQDTIERGSFTFQTRHVELGGFTYHDEYTGRIRASGQEVIRIGEIVYSRAYSGGTLKEEELEARGINEQEVIGHLVKIILAYSDRTRLDTDFAFSEEGSDWDYSYIVTERDESFGLIKATEIIKYKGEIVFRHDFMISPIEV